jgi:hypothetical protein
MKERDHLEEAEVAHNFTKCKMSVGSNIYVSH